MSDNSLEGRMNMWKKLKPHFNKHINTQVTKSLRDFNNLILICIRFKHSFFSFSFMFSEPHSHFALILIKAARHQFL